MTLNRMPIFLWEKLVLSLMVIFAMPAVMVVSSMLLLDRLVGTQFFNPAEAGDALLYQHLFWFFGHPEVYILFLPGAAIVSTLLAALLPPSALRLYTSRCFRGGHRLPELQRVGAPHVRHRPPANQRRVSSPLQP